MKVFVIAPLDGGRHEPLLRQLAAVPRFEVVVWPARMLHSVPPDHDVLRARALNNLDLTPGEIGCASSHRNVWLEASNSGDDWSLVLEDDARIADGKLLTSVVDEVRSLPLTNPATVVSLYSQGAVLRHWPNGLFTACRAEPASGVAYFLTPQAGKILADANEGLCFRSDWPRATGVDFFLVTSPVVRHGDSEIKSLVGNRMNDSVRRSMKLGDLSMKKMSNRLSLYTYFHYFRYSKQFDGPVDYYRKILRHRLIWHVARIAARRRRIDRHYVLTLEGKPPKSS